LRSASISGASARAITATSGSGGGARAAVDDLSASGGVDGSLGSDASTIPACSTVASVGGFASILGLDTAVVAGATNRLGGGAVAFNERVGTFGVPAKNLVGTALLALVERVSANASGFAEDGEISGANIRALLGVCVGTSSLRSADCATLFGASFSGVSSARWELADAGILVPGAIGSRASSRVTISAGNESRGHDRGLDWSRSNVLATQVGGGVPDAVGDSTRSSAF
jgi:hypothetical protein